jgi:ketosteroid isomerase-like protein
VPQHEHPNVIIARQGFQAFSAGDTEWLARHLSDDIVWHVGGRSKLAGTYKGKQEVLALFARQAPVLGSARIEPHDVVGNDEHVIAVGTGIAQDPAGGTVEWRWANVFHVRDEQVIEAWGLSEDPSEIDALIDKLV